MSLVMSTNYTDTLKRIKEAEEASNREVSVKKKDLEAELHDMEKVADESIEVAKRDAEIHVNKEVESSRQAAQKEADTLLTRTKKKADDIAAKRLDKRELKQIIDGILFSEFEE